MSKNVLREPIVISPRDAFTIQGILTKKDLKNFRNLKVNLPNKMSSQNEISVVNCQI